MFQIPNKIYIQTTNGKCVSSEWTNKPSTYFVNEEYIRKDALLSWAETMKSICSNTKYLPEVYQSIINKLKQI